MFKKILNFLDAEIDGLEPIQDINNTFIKFLLTGLGATAIGIIGICCVILSPLVLIMWLLSLIPNLNIKFIFVSRKMKKHTREVFDEYKKNIEEEFKGKKLFLNGYTFNGKNYKYTLESFILDFLKRLNLSYHTYIIDENLNDKLHCTSYRRRSLGDIYLICKYYFPNCTIEQVLKILIKLTTSHKIGSGYCVTIKKYVFHVEHTISNFHNPTEYDSTKTIKFKDIINAYK